MLITGLVKLSLVDFDNEVSSTIFLAGCNMRCKFCHNYEFVVFNRDSIETFDRESIINFIKDRKAYMSAICITGGEPTLNPDLVDFIKEIKAFGLKVKLDSNGTNPDMIIDLFKEGLIDYVAIDVKNSRSEYYNTIGTDSIDLTLIDKTISFLISHNYPYEFRTTLIEPFHTVGSITEMGKWINGANKIFLQKFEMSEHVPDKTLKPVETKNALEFKHILEQYVKEVNLRGY